MNIIISAFVLMLIIHLLQQYIIWRLIRIIDKKLDGGKDVKNKR